MAAPRGFRWNDKTFRVFRRSPTLLPVPNGMVRASSAYVPILYSELDGRRALLMTSEIRKECRCAIYTRVSTEHGLEQEFNSLDAQREAAEAYIKSQRHEGWQLIRTIYDDGGYSGGTTNRPALQKLLADIRERKIDIVVVYKVDRLTRSLADFAKLIELFDAHSVSFVSVTQAFNTTTSMGRLTLNVLLSFAQFEREVTGERIRDKIAASKRKGIRMGGPVPLGYDVKEKKLQANAKEVTQVRLIFQRYLDLGCLTKLTKDLRDRGIRTKRSVRPGGRFAATYPLPKDPSRTCSKIEFTSARLFTRRIIFPANMRQF